MDEKRYSPAESSAMKYAVVIEKATSNYSAFVPDLPGCVATGETIAEVEAEISAAIRFHPDGLQEDGQPIPVPSYQVQYLAAAT
jgi:predicted RNase H-like HicB family nuclease